MDLFAGWVFLDLERWTEILSRLKPLIPYEPFYNPSLPKFCQLVENIPRRINALFPQVSPEQLLSKLRQEAVEQTAATLLEGAGSRE